MELSRLTHLLEKTVKLRLIMLGLILALTGATAFAIEHPGCKGKDNKLCDTLGLLINAKGKGCFRLMTVVVLGNDSYRLTCELASYDKSLVTYVLRFTNGNKSYTVE